MVVCCQKCLKRYYLDDEVLGSDGKHVRCTSCQHVWHQRPLENHRNALIVLSESTKQSEKKPFPYLKYACICSSLLFLFLCILAVFYNKNVFEFSQITEALAPHSRFFI
jgi:predicted Zn finger-like uncharacterized protein